MTESSKKQFSDSNRDVVRFILAGQVEEIYNCETTRTVLEFLLNFLDQLKSSDDARLIPTLPESKREERATSILLATFRVVPTFALDMLKEAGAPTGKRVKVHCLTEVVPKGQDGAKLRPDGIVIIDTGRSIWSAIIESKVGLNQLESAQIES